MSWISPYGTWPSFWTAAAVASSALRLDSVTLDSDDVYWIEGRPAEGGRSVLVRRTWDGTILDILPRDANVRTRVHEYGGGAYLVWRREVYYVEYSDQRLYRLDGTGGRAALTPSGPWRYADFVRDPRRKRLMAVREEHGAAQEPINTLVSVALEGAEDSGQVVASGYDFYSTPRFSPDGRHLSWLSWRHPDMPWDATELWVADVAQDGSLGHPQRLAGGVRESIFQPGWSPDGVLYFVSDRSNWWNLYRCVGGGVEAVCSMEAEFGRPQWGFGTTTWAFASRSFLVVSFLQHGHWHLATIDVETGRLQPIDTEWEPHKGTLAVSKREAFFVGGSPRHGDAVVQVDLGTGVSRVVRTAVPPDTDSSSSSISEAQHLECVGEHGTLHAYHYPPTSATCLAPEDERPPLIVISHGGPTAAASTTLNPIIQYWASRGFAVVDVDYGGSSGYGREYRQRLAGTWGIVDVADCVAAARALVERGLADPARLIIRGASAGGYTTLAALTFRPDVFKAGASYYGISDLEILVRDTHKFESRYGDTLIGPFGANRDRYYERSPIHFVDRLSCPLIVFQGEDDKVVPPNQSQLIVDAVRAKGLPVAMLLFAGEQHGFRKAETIVRCLEAELYFYGVVFGFVPADELAPMLIDNLAGPGAR